MMLMKKRPVTILHLPSAATHAGGESCLHPAPSRPLPKAAAGGQLHRHTPVGQYRAILAGETSSQVTQWSFAARAYSQAALSEAAADPGTPFRSRWPFRANSLRPGSRGPNRRRRSAVVTRTTAAPPSRLTPGCRRAHRPGPSRPAVPRRPGPLCPRRSASARPFGPAARCD